MIIAFIKDLFLIGKSSGSIFSEALELFRTVQRMSATPKFKAHLSHEFYEVFSWAFDLIDAIKSFFYFRPLTEFETFYLYNYAIPLAISVFIVGGAVRILCIVQLILCGVAFMLGCGLGFIHISKKISIALIVVAIILIIAAIIYHEMIYDLVHDLYDYELAILAFSFSLLQALLVFTLLMIPIFKRSRQLSFIYMIVSLSLVLISFLIELPIIFCTDYTTGELGYVFNSFAMSCMSLLIVPATKSFMAIYDEFFMKNWRIIAGYAFFSLALPILITILMIAARTPIMAKKYRKFAYSFFEIYDIANQVAYAISAELDISWACIGLEIGYVVLMFAIRPFREMSEYILKSGEAFIIMASNGVALSVEKNGDEFISKNAALALFICACICPVLGLFAFYIFDFNEDESMFEMDEEIMEKSGIIMFFVTPVGWIFFGFSIPLWKWIKLLY